MVEVVGCRLSSGGRLLPAAMVTFFQKDDLRTLVGQLKPSEIVSLQCNLTSRGVNRKAGVSN